MRVVQFLRKDAPHVFGTGIEVGARIVDISHICASSLELVTGGSRLAKAVQGYLDQSPPSIPTEDVTLEAPITKMDKVNALLICIGLASFGLYNCMTL